MEDIGRVGDDTGKWEWRAGTFPYTKQCA